MIPQWLAGELEKGPISFERFMAQALYHPSHGYYSKGISGVGREGDFSTTSTLSPALARGVAHWVREELEIHHAKAPFHLIEVGPGNGVLARGVLAALPWFIRRKVQLHLVEVSPPLKEQQETALKKHRGRVHWHDSIEEALHSINENERAVPLLYTNELLDAFPVRVFRREGDAIYELHLRHDQDRLHEEWLPAHNIPDSELQLHSWPEKQRLEISARAKRWFEETVAPLRRGSLLTIDYGGSAEEIYHRRPMGSLRAYFQHQCLTGPAIYDNIGFQDLTADVNFDDLEAWGRSLGLEAAPRLTQAEFLDPFLSSAATDRFVTSENGAGSAFKVLIQRRR